MCTFLAPAKCKEGVNIIAVPVATSTIRRLAVCICLVAFHAGAIDDVKFVRLTCSIGFAAFPFLAEDAPRIGWEEVVDVADVCLYAAKRAGRNCWVGGFVSDCSSPDTIIARVRQSAADLIASGELTIVSSSLGAFAGAPRSEIAS